MSTTSAKRSLEPSLSTDLPEVELNESPTSEEPRKKGGKPGRKPLDNEAKTKRTAQNRAAQRAFRERKEKKMNQLEDKVRKLEELNQQSLVETEFLRSQLVTLVSELKRYRPENPKDSKVLEYLAKTENVKPDDSLSQNNKQLVSDCKEIEENVRRKMSFTFAFPWKSEFSGDPKDKSGSISSTDEQLQQRPGGNNLLMQFPSPGSSLKSSQSLGSMKNKNDNLTPLNGGSSTSSSGNGGMNRLDGSISSGGSNGFTPGAASTGWMDNVFYDDDAQELQPFHLSNNNGNEDEHTRNLFQENTALPDSYDGITFSNEFNFNDKFDEQVSEFCSKLGQVCGTRECPIPQKQRDSYSSPAPASTAAPKSPVLFSNTWDTPSEDLQQQQQQQPAWLEDNPSVRPTNLYHNNNDDGGSGTNSNNNNGNNNNNNDHNNQNNGGSSSSSNDKNTNENRSPSDTNSALPFIDASLAFPEEQDLFRESQPDNMFTEFLEQDPHKDTNNEKGDSNSKDNVKEGKFQADEQRDTSNIDGVVPSSDGKLLKCSEIWDRITTHPKYSDVDIDGLCHELMAKAKCSERGVVVQAEDVQNALKKAEDNEL